MILGDRPLGNARGASPGENGRRRRVQESRFSYFVERMWFTAMRPEVTAKDEAVPSPTFRS